MLAILNYLVKIESVFNRHKIIDNYGLRFDWVLSFDYLIGHWVLDIGI